MPLRSAAFLCDLALNSNALAPFCLSGLSRLTRLGDTVRLCWRTSGLRLRRREVEVRHYSPEVFYRGHVRWDVSLEHV